MDRRKFISLSKIRRRARSEARGEEKPNEDPMEVEPVMLRPTESSPDLGAGPSTLPTSGLQTPDNQTSSGMQIGLFRIIHLIAFFPLIQTATMILV